MIFRRPRPIHGLLALTFVVGACVMAIELIASRFLAPFFGASIFVWTSLILIVLVALAVGYWLGGRAAERGKDLVFLGAIISVSAGLLLFGIWLSSGFSLVLTLMLTSWSSSSVALFLGSLVAAAAAFGLPILVLGMVGPLVMKALAREMDVGRASGLYLMVSTAGSVVGTVAPTLLLVPNLGSKMSLMLVALTLFVTGSVCAMSGRRRWMFLLFAAVPLTATYFWPTPDAPMLLHEEDSAYQYIRVVDDGERRVLKFNDGTGIQSVSIRPGEKTGLYYDYIAAVPLLRPPTPLNTVAILGLAGGTVAQNIGSLLPTGTRLDITGVELDSSVIAIAKRYFGLDDAKVHVVEQDARIFLNTTDRRYDTMIVDCYSTQLYIPPHVSTREFFRLVRSHLNAGGVMALNVNTTGQDTPLFQGLGAAVSAEFPYVAVLPVPGSWNKLIVASDQPFDFAATAGRVPAGNEDILLALSMAEPVELSPNARAFTDDWAPVEFMTDAMILQEAVKQKLL